MPHNKAFPCDTSLKKSVIKFHDKCCNNRHSYKVLGKYLNLLPEIDTVFDEKKHYVVCRSLYWTKLLPLIENEQNGNHANVDQNTDLNETPPKNIPVADPSPQQINENENNVDQNSGLNEPPPKNVSVAVPPPPQVNENESNTDQSDDLVEHPSNNLTVALPPL